MSLPATIADTVKAITLLAPLIESVAKWRRGEGPRPPALEHIPEISQSKLAELEAEARLARLERG